MSLRILTVVGARPQFVKAAVVSQTLREHGIEEVLVHTGQHYDHGLSQVFFDELDLQAPDYNLGVGSDSHAAQTGAMMVGLERLLLDGPSVDWVLVYGDTNSTIAAALVAAKLHRKLAHVEAGLRSFNRRMPEEINRIVTDRLSDLLFCPTPTAVTNLGNEGLTAGVVMTGDVMLDATRFFLERAARTVRLDSVTRHEPGAYALATVHRAENTDDPIRLAGILEGLGSLGLPVVLPLHPRTRSRLKGAAVAANIEIIDPVGYLAMLILTRNARRVLTDSGGLQKEALWLGTPCVTLRDETEWVETLEGGWNRLAGADSARIVQLASLEPDGPVPTMGEVPGTTSSRLIARALLGID